MFQFHLKKRKVKKLGIKQKIIGYFPIELFDGLKRQQLISPGFFIFIFLIIIPLLIWLWYQPESINNPIIALAKFNAFMAISSLSVNFILSTRLKIFERLFFGLDRMYRVHKMIGRISLFFMLLHPLFLIISSFPDWNRIISYIIPIGDFAVSTGIIAIYIFLLLLTFTVAIHLPYHWWHNSHKFLGIVLILAGYHAVIAGSDINSYFYLRYWIIGISSLGVICWFYMLLFYKRIGPRYVVKLESVEKTENITELTIKKPAKFDFQPGQFLFIRFPRFEGNKELLPFTISNDPSQDFIRLSIKQSGDYTGEKIPLLKPGDHAIIMGPYGQFGNRYLRHDKDMIWVAGGIGITPFLSLATHESVHPSGRRVDLIWVVNNSSDAFHDKELQDEMEKNPNFQYIHWFSEEKGRITAEDIIQIIGGKNKLKNRLIFMCGPPGLTYSLCKGFKKQGISYRNMVFEDFNMLD